MSFFPKDINFHKTSTSQKEIYFSVNTSVCYIYSKLSSTFSGTTIAKVNLIRALKTNLLPIDFYYTSYLVLTFLIHIIIFRLIYHCSCSPLMSNCLLCIYVMVNKMDKTTWNLT